MTNGVKGARRQWKIAALVVTALLATLTMAIAADRSDRITEDASATKLFQFPDDYVGPVWVQLGDTEEVVDLRLEWGSWGAQWSVGPNDARSYWFSKGANAGDNPPLMVTVTPATELHIGYGQMPAGTRATSPTAWFLLDDSADQ